MGFVVQWLRRPFLAIGAVLFWAVCAAADPGTWPSALALFSGLQPGMTVAQVHEVLAHVAGAANIIDRLRPDQSPLVTQATVADETITVFFASGGRGGKAYRLLLSNPLGERRLADVRADWIKRFGAPTAAYYIDNLDSGRFGWGLRPGPEGSLVRVGRNPLRVLGEVFAPDLVILTIIDDDLAD